MWSGTFTLFSYVFAYYVHVFFAFGTSGPRSGPKIIFVSYSWSYFVHIIFIFLYIPGLGPLSIPQSLKTSGLQKAIPSKFTKKQLRSNEQNMKMLWFHNFTWFSHSFYMIFIFLLHFGARDPDPGPKSHIFVIFLVILFSYYFHIFVYPWAGPPVHSAIFENYSNPGDDRYIREVHIPWSWAAAVASAQELNSFRRVGRLKITGGGQCCNFRKSILEG